MEHTIFLLKEFSAEECFWGPFFRIELEIVGFSPQVRGQFRVPMGGKLPSSLKLFIKRRVHLLNHEFFELGQAQVAIFVQVSSFQEETNFAGLYVEALLVVKLIVQFLDGEFSVLVRIRIVEETLDVWSVDVVEKMICRGATMLLAST